jgi:hypothetical protein
VPRLLDAAEGLAGGLTRFDLGQSAATEVVFEQRQVRLDVFEEFRVLPRPREQAHDAREEYADDAHEPDSRSRFTIATVRAQFWASVSSCVSPGRVTR